MTVAVWDKVLPKVKELAEKYRGNIDRNIGTTAMFLFT